MLLLRPKHQIYYHVCDELLALYDTLQRSSKVYHRTYYDRFQLCVMHKRTLPQARISIVRALKHAEQFYGKTSREAARARELKRSMAKHGNYLALM